MKQLLLLIAFGFLTACTSSSSLDQARIYTKKSLKGTLANSRYIDENKVMAITIPDHFNNRLEELNVFFLSKFGMHDELGTYQEVSVFSKSWVESLEKTDTDKRLAHLKLFEMIPFNKKIVKLKYLHEEFIEGPEGTRAKYFVVFLPAGGTRGDSKNGFYDAVRGYLIYPKGNGYVILAHSYTYGFLETGLNAKYALDNKDLIPTILDKLFELSTHVEVL